MAVELGVSLSGLTEEPGRVLSEEVAVFTLHGSDESLFVELVTLVRDLVEPEEQVVILEVADLGDTTEPDGVVEG